MIFVTGVSGDLGRALAARADVAGSVHSRPLPGRHALDVRDAAAVRRAFATERPDVVIHTAYRQDDDTVTRDGAAVVATEAARAGARLIHLSSDLVFRGALGRALTEDDAPDALAGYGRAKADAERLVAEAHPDALIVRTSLLLGAPGPPLRHELMARDPGAFFYDDELRSPMSAGDLADALLELASLDVGGVLHIAGADDVTRLELARLINPSARGGPGPPERPKVCALDCARARALLSTRLRGVRELLG
ncbi:MAG TPA: sugar nucleotide-binding protein [Solirubrobacteraceae bacterium]